MNDAGKQHKKAWEDHTLPGEFTAIAIKDAG